MQSAEGAGGGSPGGRARGRSAAGGGERSGSGGGGSSARNDGVSEQMEALSLNGGSMAAAAHVIDGIVIEEAEGIDGAPAVDESTSAASQSDAAEPSARARLAWALDGGSRLIWVLITARGVQGREEIWCQVKQRGPNDELHVLVLNQCTHLPWDRGHELEISRICVREVLTKEDWMAFAELEGRKHHEHLQQQQQQQYSRGRMQ